MTELRIWNKALSADEINVSTGNGNAGINWKEISLP